MIRILYNISLYLYSIIIRIATLFNQKAKLWIRGREDIFLNVKSALNNSESQNSPLIWFHCASLGEFEQGRPLIEKIKSQHPEYKILLTFFSPSGYEVRKDYSGADYIFYLPLDTTYNAKKFIRLVNPKAVFFVKYEFWFNYLNELKQQNIPLYLVSGIFREDQLFFKSYGSWFRKQLNCFTYFFLQDEYSSKLLNSIGFKNNAVVGDTRFDRVDEIAKNVKLFPIIKQFKQDSNILIAGSTWEEDEKIISKNFKNSKSQILNFKLIIAPHEIDESHINSIVLKFNNFKIIRYSQANENNINGAQVLIIDNIGMLSSLYQYGNIAYIGGGFGKGIHNILEAATFGLPVIFGPNYQKFSEAKELIKLGGAFSINNDFDLNKTIESLNDKIVRQVTANISKQYVQSRIGATDKILSAISLK
jgi:3-deoxy-D-manno-octulosonic-acid transferase